MSVSSRKTYDTDSIALRRIFAYDISNNSPFSTGYILTSLTKGVVSFQSPTLSLSSIGWVNLPAQISTLSGELFSTSQVMASLYPSSTQFFLPSTVAGLGSSGYVSTSYLAQQLRSTSVGLGTLGYLSSSVVTVPITSTVVGLGTVGYVSSSQLASTVGGLGSSSYISTLSLQSTIEGLASSSYISSSQLASTVSGLGSSSYISTLSLQSTITGLGSSSYISSSQLASTVSGLGSAGFLSTVRILRSTFQNINLPTWSNAGFLYSNVDTNTVSLSTISFDMGDAMRSQIIPNVTKLDIELKPNIQFAYYDTTSGNYQFNSLLTQGTSFDNTKIIGREALTYYILNSNVINLSFFFQEKLRFLITDPAVLTNIRDDAVNKSFTLHHTFFPRIPATNQFFASPASTICATVVLDNTSR